MTARIFLVLSVAVTAGAEESSLFDASTAYLESLSSAERGKAVLPFNSDERLNWHFIPKERLGINFKEMNDKQDELVLNILRAGLSESGFTQAETIRSLEIILHEMEGADFRDPELYHILFFGEPAESGPWSLRYEGHHVSLNWTLQGRKVIASSPQFFGSNPAEVRIDGPKRGLRALAGEEDLGRKLLNSMTAAQRDIAIISQDVPRDIYTANQQRAERQPDQGIMYRQLDAQQQGFLLAVIEESASVQPPSISKYRLDQIREAGLDDIYFAWIGDFEKGQPHYYRVQGPTFLIEYDNIQNDANHVHIVWRDFDGDFGQDILKAHYTRHFDPQRPLVHAH